MSKATQGKSWRRVGIVAAVMIGTLLCASEALTAPVTPYLQTATALRIAQTASNGNGNGNGQGYSKKNLRPRYAAAKSKGHKPHTKDFKDAAYLPATGNLLPATNTAAPAPQSPDLSETIDVTFTPAIRTLATSLGNNPVKIYNWVRDNIVYTPTYGSIQGADATLQTLRGNDYDTASLLIALLRAANVPARYAYGTIEVPAAAAQNWVGGVSVPEAAVALFDQGGVPVQGVISGGGIASLQIEHVWVEAFVDFNPSRGAVNRSASTWVPLDASFKQYRFTPGLPVRSSVPVDTAALATQLAQGATITTNGVAGLNTSTLSAAYSTFTAQVNAYIAGAKANATVNDVLGSQSTMLEDLPILAGALPYKVVTPGAIYSTLPDTLRWQVQYGLYASEYDRTQGNAIVSTTQWLPQLVGKRLTLSFNGATSADAGKLAAALNATPLPTSINGGPIQTSAQLTVDGQVVSNGGSIAFGTTLVGGLGVFEPQAGVWTYTPSSRVVAGETHALATVGQGTSPAMLSASRDRLASMAAQMNAGQYAGLDQDAFVGEVLNNAALSYMTTVTGNSDLMCKACGIVSYALPMIARVNTRAAPSYSNGIPQAVSFPGVALTIEEIGRTAVAADNNAAKALAFQRSYGERASAYTHLLLDALFTDANRVGRTASSVRALDAATAAGRQVDFITSNNGGTLIPQLNVDPATVSVLQDAIAAGRTATISQGSVTIDSWTGAGYVLEDPGIGSGDYEVSGRDEAQLSVAGGWLPLALAGSAFPVQGSAVAGAVGGILQAETNYYPAAVALLANYGTIPWANFVAAPLVVSQWWLCSLWDGLPAALNDGTAALVSLVNVDNFTPLPGAPQTNDPPYFTSAPAVSGAVGQPYQYFATAVDPDGNAIAFSLVNGPSGMTMSAGGLLSWASPIIGSYPITIRVSDGQANADQSFTLTVGQVMPLDLSLGIAPQFVNDGDTVTITVATSGGSGTVSKTLTVDGSAVALDANGQAKITAHGAGAHPVVATAKDNKVTLSKSDAFGVHDPNLTSPPSVAIIAPADSQTLTAPTAVTGTVSDANLLNWKLMASPAGQAQWTLLNSGMQTLTNAALGTFDPTRLTNGQYDLGLFATDVNGQQASQVITVLVWGNLKIGQFTVSFNDLQLDVGGIPLTVTRTYDSRKKDTQSDFGYGWTLGYQNVALQRNRVLGENWEIYQPNLLTFCVRPVGKRTVSIAMADGKMHQFDIDASNNCAVGQVPTASLLNLNFVPRPGTTSSLDILDGGNWLFQGNTVYDADTGSAFDSFRYRLTTLEGYQYILTSSNGARTFQVAQIIDPNGQSLTFTQNAVTSSVGMAIQFQRDSQGRITQISDPAGRTVRYGYTAAGDLDSITDPTARVSRNQYATVPATLAHLLTAYTDPSGALQLRNEYDATGKLIAQYDAFGNKIDFSQRDTANQTQKVTDRNGNTTTYTYDSAGNITQIVDALGNQRTYAFDQYGNQLSRTDALGRTTKTTYDAPSGTVLAQVDPLGNTTSSEWNFYSQMGNHTPQNLKSTTDALGNKTTYSYLPTGMLSQVADPLGNATGFAWGGTNNDQLTQLTDATGNKTTYQNDAQGHKIQETDPLGNITKYTYDTAGHLLTTTKTRATPSGVQTLTASQTVDADGNVLSQTDALGHTTTNTWTAQKKLATQIDPLGRVTTYSYDASGQLTKTLYPDGTNVVAIYDANGNTTQEIDRAGRKTTTAYDALDRPITITNADGTTTSTGYDAAGQVAQSSDELGRITTYAYDAAGRKTGATDPNGNSVGYVYDAAGKLTKTTDALNRALQYTYDAGSRKTQTIWADGSASKYEYDAAGRKTKDTDPSGRATQYGYDANGRLNKVTNALGQITSYGYDELGNKTSQTDALAHVTTWGYDGLGHATSHTLADNRYETFAYDAAGRLTNRTDYASNAIGFQYDAADRVTNQTFSDNSTTSTTYTASGQIATLTRSISGASTTTKYSYDARNRLTDLQNPDGSKLHYVYDAAGQKTSLALTTPDGTTQQTDYTYDPAGNLITVATNGKTFTYTYDAANQKTGRTDPNGNVTKYSYDLNGRLTGWVTTQGSAANAPVLEQGTYTLNAAGQRTQLVYLAPDGQTRTLAYTYDGAGKLTGETRSLPNTVTTWVLDAVGNRTGQTQNGQTSGYSYDSTDRLTQITGANLAAYAWDPNGQLSNKTEGTGVGAKTTTYTFDARHQLIGATLPDGTKIAYRYQADGNLASRTKTKTDGTTTTTHYLVDTNLAFAQVVAEYDDAGKPTASYTYGDELLQRTRAGQNTYFHHDGQGTVDALTDDTGAAAQTYGYDAWGNPVEAAGTDDNPYRYAGERYDTDLGLIYLRARWYDPKVGRFVSADPFDGVSASPITLHKYVYGGGDPANRKDPSGLFFDAGGTMVALADIAGSELVSATTVTTISTALLLRLALYVAVSTVGTYVVVDVAIKTKIKECVDSSRKGENKCKPEYNIFILGDNYDQVRDHVGDAFGDGYPSLLSAKDPPWSRSWLDALKGPGKSCSGAAGTDCDEYPFASSLEGGQLNGPSLRSVSASQNRGAGAQLRWFYEKCQVPKNIPAQKYKVLAIKGLPETGYVCAR